MCSQGHAASSCGPAVCQTGEQHAAGCVHFTSSTALQVEDIIDTGATLKRVVARLQEAGAASVKVSSSNMHRGVRSALQTACKKGSQLRHLASSAVTRDGDRLNVTSNYVVSNQPRSGGAGGGAARQGGAPEGRHPARLLRPAGEHVPAEAGRRTLLAVPAAGRNRLHDKAACCGRSGPHGELPSGGDDSVPPTVCSVQTSS